MAIRISDDRPVATMHRFIVILITGLWVVSSIASENLLDMVRVEQPFPEAMQLVKAAITRQGYTVTRVQKVDYGLKKLGFETDEYQIVFYGKPEEVTTLSKQFPELIPFLPLKIIVFAEGLDTILVADKYITLNRMYNNRVLKKYFTRWQSDTTHIFNQVKQIVQKP